MESNPYGLEYATPDLGHGMTASVQNGLGVYYLLVLLLNLGFAAYLFFAEKKPLKSLIWTLVGGVFFIHGVVYLLHMGWVIPHSVRNVIDLIMGPVTYFAVSVIAFFAFIWFRKFFTEP